ncbi:hypothetical protein BJN45_08215 [Azonexus hydrophilus]|uniref:Glycosyltransferase 2-like domain-containing protein n=1 Tax=Azonexus hydrophilus TaxID=418702 RepID=A0A1R1I8P4_9RHOO|nr:glycosyltransferase [Azonexus hydrophilus]OMG55121.1 hypothetical protein BJN45_08215 [Azonexus hydrophilus]
MLYKVAVVCITYKRPHGLKKLLLKLDDLTLVAADISIELTVVVVDNDSEMSSSTIVNECSSVYKNEIIYVVASEQGIPIARNLGVDSVPAQCDYFCFIDDDEYPDELWLVNLIKTINKFGCDCVAGPVVPIFPVGSNQWIVSSGMFNGWIYEDGKEIFEAASNNVIVKTEFVRNTKVRFEEKMRMTGGSDYLFFRQLVEKNIKIRWSANAIVFEDIPISRVSWRWVFNRQFRLGNTFAVSQRIIGHRFGLFFLFVKGMLRILLGISLMPFIFNPKLGGRAIVHFFRGLGMAIGVFGVKYEEYSNKALLKDRQN